MYNTKYSQLFKRKRKFKQNVIFFQSVDRFLLGNLILSFPGNFPKIFFAQKKQKTNSKINTVNYLKVNKSK